MTDQQTVTLAQTIRASEWFRTMKRSLDRHVQPTTAQIIALVERLTTSSPTSDTKLTAEALARADHFWCVEVDGEFALAHEWQAHLKQAEYVLAHLTADDVP